MRVIQNSLPQLMYIRKTVFEIIGRQFVREILVRFEPTTKWTIAALPSASNGVQACLLSFISNHLESRVAHSDKGT